MVNPESPLITDALQRRLRDGASAAQLATDVAETWRRVEDSLQPIIGPAGVAALYKRSLQLAGRSHPWLAELYGQGNGAFAVLPLISALVKQNSHAGALGAGELMETFYKLVSSMVGAALTRKLLHFMWNPFEVTG